MSNASDIYDAITSKLLTLFPSKQRLHNPYELTDNPELIMKDAYGIKIGSGSYSEMEFCNLSIEREYRFILMRQFASVGTSGTAFDSVSKSIIEDQQSFLNLIYSPTELGVHDKIDKIDISDITGIEFMQSEQKKYLFCEVAFRITMSNAII